MKFECERCGKVRYKKDITKADNQLLCKWCILAVCIVEEVKLMDDRIMKFDGKVPFQIEIALARAFDTLHKWHTRNKKWIGK